MGNFSRVTFDELKKYVSVRLQQGVPLVDADWNEMDDMRRYELRSFIKWFIGNGVPAGNKGFRIKPVETKGIGNILLEVKKILSKIELAVDYKKSTAAKVLGFGPNNFSASGGSSVRLGGTQSEPYALEDGMTLVGSISTQPLLGRGEPVISKWEVAFKGNKAATAMEVIAAIKKGAPDLIASEGFAADFMISGGDGTFNGAGRCLVDGWEALNESDLNYSGQQLYDHNDLAAKWGVDSLSPITIAAGARTDLVYLDVWEREITSLDDSALVDQRIGIETCVRLKREWVVRILEGCDQLQVPDSWLVAGNTLQIRKQDHGYYPLAQIHHNSALPISDADIHDLRRSGLTVLSEEITIKDGNVGIGTTDPKAPLHVAQFMAIGPYAATDAQQGSLSVTGPNAGLGFVKRSLAAWPAAPAAGDRFAWYNQDGTARLWTDQKGDLLSVTGAGNVIVGTPGPEDKYLFEVAGRMKVRSNGVDTAGIWFSQKYGFGEKAFVGLSDDNHIGFWGNTGANWGLVMDTKSGNVGIGTMTPNAKLEVSGVDGDTHADFSVKGRLQSVSVHGGGLFVDASMKRFLGSDAGTGIGLFNGAWRLVVRENKNIGIGMEITDGAVLVKKDNDYIEIDPWVGSNGTAISFVDNNTTKANLYWHKISQTFHINSGGASGTSINSNGGHVGIGMLPNSNYILSVKGNAYASGGQWLTSDKQYKKNIITIKNALSGILAIRGVSHEWRTEKYADKGFTDGRHLGVIAQEIEGVFPEVIKDGPDGDKAVAYTGFVPILIEAIKEQQTMIDKMAKKLEALEISLKKNK